MEGLSVGGGIGKGESFESVKRRFGEVEEKNERLEVKIRRLTDEVELSVGKIKRLEAEKAGLRDEVCALSRRNEELAERVNWFEGVGIGRERGEGLENSRVMVENEGLKCWKRVAEEEAEVLREKIVELEARVAELEGGVGIKSVEKGVNFRKSCSDVKSVAGEESVNLTVPLFTSPCAGEQAPPATRDLNTPAKVTPCMSRGKTSRKGIGESLDGIRTRRKMAYNRQRRSSPTMVNSKTVGIIAISDSEEDENTTQKNMHISAIVNSIPGDACSSDDEEVFVSGELKRPFVDSSCNELYNRVKESGTPKRKRNSNVVNSDSENDDMPIGMLLKKNIANHDQQSSSEDEVDTILVDSTQPSIPQRRQRLVSLSQLYEANKTHRNTAVERNLSQYQSDVHCMTRNVLDDCLEDSESESEGESLGGFIVKSSDSISDNSSCHDCFSDGNNAPIESLLLSDSDMNYEKIMSKLRRDKDHKMNWEYESDMLSAFGKDSDLCLKAICALYRQQTSDEKQCKGTIHANGRGFNQLDALRGSQLAEFLTDGDPFGPIKKSAEELEKYYPNGVELCRDLARRYSKQLFTIFQNKEDPLFHSAL